MSFKRLVGVVIWLSVAPLAQTNVITDSTPRSIPDNATDPVSTHPEPDNSTDPTTITTGGVPLPEDLVLELMFGCLALTATGAALVLGFVIESEFWSKPLYHVFEYVYFLSSRYFLIGWLTYSVVWFLQFSDVFGFNKITKQIVSSMWSGLVTLSLYFELGNLVWLIAILDLD